jgi:hypothetical protein
MEGQSAAKLLRRKLLDEKYLNKTFGVMNVLDFSHKEIYRSFYKCKCSRCNNITSIRTDALIKGPKSCSYCVDSYMKEMSELKYGELRKYRNIYQNYKGNAKHVNRVFDLTLEDVILIIDSSCYYCGDINSNGIDRINNDIGYTIENSVPCCYICNQMKHKFTKEVFLNQISLIYKKHLKESSTTIP